MKRLIVLTLAALALGVFSVSDAFGYWTEGSGAYGSAYTRERTTMETGFKVSWLLGRTVRNTEREDLGSVGELLVAENGRIKYVILDQGGIFGRGILGRGIGDELFAVPWSAMTVDAKARMLSLNIDKDKLKGAPTFKKGEWASFEDPEFEGTVHGYYGLEEGQTAIESSEKGLMRGTYKASLFMGKPVMNAQGEQLGYIRDMVAGEEGRIRYVIVSHSGGFFGMGGKLTPVPWGAMKFNNKGLTATLDMDKERFLGAPGIAGSDWRKLDDPDWNGKVLDYFGMERKGF